MGWRNAWFVDWFDDTSPKFLTIPGAIFLALGTSIWLGGVTTTYLCRSDLREGNVTEVHGLLTIDPDSKIRKGAFLFSIDRGRYATAKTGQCDCGFIAAMGKRILPAENHQVRALVRDGVVLQLERLP